MGGSSTDGGGAGLCLRVKTWTGGCQPRRDPCGSAERAVARLTTPRPPPPTPPRSGGSPSFQALQNSGVDGLFFGDAQVVRQQHFGGVRLRVDVDEQRALALAGQPSRQRNTGGRFPGASFLIGD